MKDWPQTVTELTAHLRNLGGGGDEGILQHCECCLDRQGG